MKLNLILLLILLFVSGLEAFVVKDPFLIAVSLENARQDLVAQAKRETNQRTQIEHLLNQVRQIDEFLDRLGDPEKIRDLEGLAEMWEFLQKLEINKDSEELLKEAKADKIFEPGEGALREAVEREIIIDGQVVAKTDERVFRTEMVVEQSLEHYREVRKEVLKQRSEIKKQWQKVLKQLESASTQSEVDKLQVIASSLEARLAATDREMQFATNEVQTRFMEQQVARDVEAKARVQRQRAAARYGTQEDLKLYQLIQEPVPFKK